MEIIYYRSPAGNFGDDLNAILWRAVLPQSCLDAEDALLLGIGSIFRDDFLSRSATAKKRVFILGSGAGTGPLPAQWPNPDWSILAVRGPLTARLIGRPTAAATDGAALLAVAKGILPHRVPRTDVVFFPHYNSVEFSRWREVSAMAGLSYVDAHWPPERVLRALAGARLVITEAMHGAVVADTLRIPWIPVVSSPAILPFKWVDWTKSLALDYRPLPLPPSSGWEALKHLKIKLTDGRHARAPIQSERDQDLIDDFHRRFGDIAAATLETRRLHKSARSALRRASAVFDPAFMGRAAEALTAAARARSYLSDDAVLAARTEQLQGSVERLVRALAN